MTTKSTSKSEPTYQSVWATLSAVNCSEHTQEKNGLTFLSWAWAWGIMMEHYPQTQYEFFNESRDEFGHVEVWCKVTIGELSRTMWLPVMDYRNNAIKNPDLRKISDTRMRCLTKCLAMFGLGHYIYAGEDLPKASEEPAEEKPKAPAKKPEPKKEQAKAESSPHDIPDEESAINVVNFMCDTVDEYHSDSQESLADFWRQNKQLIDLLDTNYQEQYQRLKAHFTHTKQKLLKGDA